MQRCAPRLAQTHLLIGVLEMLTSWYEGYRARNAHKQCWNHIELEAGQPRE